MKLALKQSKRKVIPKIRMVIYDFEFLESSWDVQVPPHLQPIESDCEVKPMIDFRVALIAKINLLEKLRVTTPSSAATDKIAPF